MDQTVSSLESCPVSYPFLYHQHRKSLDEFTTILIIIIINDDVLLPLSEVMMGYHTHDTTLLYSHTLTLLHFQKVMALWCLILGNSSDSVFIIARKY